MSPKVVAAPENWPSSLPYLSFNRHSRHLGPPQVTVLRTPPPSVLPNANSRPKLHSTVPNPAQDSTISSGTFVLTSNNPAARQPCPNVRIQPIKDENHPAFGQCGLFAARDLTPGEFIVPYLGEVHGRQNATEDQKAPSTEEISEQATSTLSQGPKIQAKEDPHASSDYDLSLDREVGLAIDAAQMGNEARFINDYRGVPVQDHDSTQNFEKSTRKNGDSKPSNSNVKSAKGVKTTRSKPNAEFRDIWDARRGEKGIAVFVLPEGKPTRSTASTGGKKKRQTTGIRKGEEILVSYGRGFWSSRREVPEESHYDDSL